MAVATSVDAAVELDAEEGDAWIASGGSGVLAPAGVFVGGADVGVTEGSKVGVTRVTVGGAGVSVGGKVLVGGIGVSVGAGVFVAATGVSVGPGVSVGAIGVLVGPGVLVGAMGVSVAAGVFVGGMGLSVAAGVLVDRPWVGDFEGCRAAVAESCIAEGSGVASLANAAGVAAGMSNRFRMERLTRHPQTTKAVLFRRNRLNNFPCPLVSPSLG